MTSSEPDGLRQGWTLSPSLTSKVLFLGNKSKLPLQLDGPCGEKRLAVCYFLHCWWPLLGLALETSS
jgi:hypothetical protein